MPTKQPPDLDALDSALASIVGSGWSGGLDAGLEAHSEPAAAAPAPKEIEYPPVPVAPEDPEQAPGGEERSAGPPSRALMDVGLLSDLVAGVKSPDQAARAAGVTVSELHSALATTLAQADAKELARAMGVQITASQLKATAVWNALLADLLEDIRSGRAKADIKLELLKVLGRIGRLEPKDDKTASAGGGFQLNINIGDGAKPVIIDSQ